MIPQIGWSLFGKKAWYNTPAYADFCAVADFNRWRFAITVVPLAEIPTATAAQLCVKRPCTAAEYLAFTCSSTAARTYTDAGGTLRADLSVDQLRRDWVNGRLQLALNGPSTNGIPNNMMVGAQVGAPGVLPDKWYWGGGDGIILAVVGLGVEDGIPYIDIAITGTATATRKPFVIAAFAGSNHIAAADGQVWAQSAFVRMLSGSALSGLGTILTVRDGAGAAITAVARANTQPAASLGASRIVGVAAIANAATAYVQPRAVFDLDAGATYDHVVRMGLPQAERNAFASPPIPTFGNAVTRAIETARLSPLLEAILQRSEGSIIVRGQNMMRPQGHIIAPQTSSLIQSNATNERAVTNSASGVLVTNIGPNFATVPYAVGVAFSGAGRAIVRNGAAVATDAGTVPARTAVYLARDGSGTFTADGWYDSLEISPYHLSNVRLAERAVAA